VTDDDAENLAQPEAITCNVGHVGSAMINR